MLDTLASCRPLSIVEQSRLEELKSKERERLAPKKAKAQAAFVERQAKKLRVKHPRLTEKDAAKIVIQQCEGILRPEVELLFDDPELEGCTVGDVLADPEKFEGETLADPLEGLDYGPCKAKIMRHANGVPWIHSFAHGRTIYHLKYDAAAIRTAMCAAPADAVATLARLAPGADIDEVELETLRQLAKELSGAGLRAINATLKAAKKQHAAQQATAMQTRAAMFRQDPRPLLPAPYLEAPWLPEMDVLNEVIGAVVADMPTVRNINGDMTLVCKRPITDMHAFTNANQPEEEDEK